MEDLSRLMANEHDAPHALLGAHEEEGRWVVRAKRPGAARLRVLSGGTATDALDRGGGLFEAYLPAATRGAYELEWTLASGAVERGADPYAFAPSVGDFDLHLFGEGKHDEVWRVLGAHVRELSPLGGGERVLGTSFAVWAPNARRVSVVGDFNAWDGARHPMRRLGPGVFELFVPGVAEGALYKFEILTARGLTLTKSDPYGRRFEKRPHTATLVERSTYEWGDAAWLEQRRRTPARRQPMAIYEVHLGSWKRAPAPLDAQGKPITEDGSPDGRFLTYRELAAELVPYVAELGFTHIELLPVTEHPFDGSWGYQTSGYFAPTSRYGSPDDFRAFVDACHQAGLGVLLDWVPAHFPKDAPFLARFDGTALYEHHDPRRGEHGHWGTLVFHWGRWEVRNFLVGSALYWLEEMHIDGLRVDAVASMLYLDYSAQGPTDWVPNEFGGNENLEAVAFLRDLSERVHRRAPGAVLIAEESTTWPGVTQPTYVGGLGFDFKWNMGWMHDTLQYFRLDPVFRNYHHRLLTFGLMYAFSERFVLPLSHDEVVHLKRSLLSKMPGSPDEQRASLRLLFAYMYAHPGKKLLFMGAELGQTTEWYEGESLPWELARTPEHAGLSAALRDVGRLLRSEPALYELDDQADGFEWVDANDASQSVASFLRYSDRAAAPDAGPRSHVLFVGNFTPVERHGYRVGVPRRCAYLEVLNTDAIGYGGQGRGNLGRVEVEDVPCHGFASSVRLYLPPLSALVLKPAETDVPDVGRGAQRLAPEPPPSGPGRRAPTRGEGPDAPEALPAASPAPLTEEQIAPLVGA